MHLYWCVLLLLLLMCLEKLSKSSTVLSICPLLRASVMAPDDTSICTFVCTVFFVPSNGHNPLPLAVRHKHDNTTASSGCVCWRCTIMLLQLQQHTLWQITTIASVLIFNQSWCFPLDGPAYSNFGYTQDGNLTDPKPNPNTKPNGP